MARPEQNADGSANLMKWKCVIPGEDGTDWAGGFYPVTMEFSSDYPAKAPKVSLPKGFFHPNIYPSGKVCLSIINDNPAEGGQWKPAIAIKQILLGVQELLDQPNNSDPAQIEGYEMLRKDPAKYKRRVKEERGKYTTPPF